MDESTHLGAFIKECRQSLGYTSRRVEEITRGREDLSLISHSNLLAIEKGRHIPTFDKILTLSQVLSVPLQHFEDHLRYDLSLQQTETDENATFLELQQAANEALRQGHDQQALALFTRSLALAVTDEAAAGDESHAARVTELRLQMAAARSRVGLLLIAKDDLERLLADETLTETVVARATFQLAEIHRVRRNLRLAELHARAAVAQAESADEPVLRGKVLNTLANIINDRGQFGQAVEYYESARVIFEEKAERRLVGMVLGNLGSAYLRLDDAQKAADYMGQGLAISRELGDFRGQGYALANLSRARWLLGDAEATREAAKAGKDIAQNQGYPDVLFLCVFYLWKVACQQGQDSLEKVYAERLSSLHDKLETLCEEADEWQKLKASRRRGPGDTR